MSQEPTSTDTGTGTRSAAMPRELCGPAKLALVVFGFVCLAVGIAGVILPGLPGTVFLLIALWAFSRSSHRLHLWLYTHPRFGAGLRAWHTHRVIPTRAKIAAVAMMSISAVTIAMVSAGDWRIPVASAAVMAAVALWIVTRPSRIIPSA